ncbi:8-amino-7-oxononanoate synthase [Hamadaea tsunoensis]|uniref:8-amino-7-oxononanoate synthase n=1 Tax=Hamadaea tsunoensis TaxID=53368 RepID=UPI00041963AF|nr:8-amino-7-oxononanoate synthase [Hamadaea tsunoensis]
MGWLDTLARKAELRERAGLRRRLRTRTRADDLVDLAGNDYLGLARHPEVVAAAAAALSAYGLGATGSRLVRGTTDLHAALEAELADWTGTPTALVYSSGYLANLGAVKALTGPNSVIVADAYVHASLIDGCRLAGVETVMFRHGDAADARRLLAGQAGKRALVLTESIFSVDGDLAPLADLHAATREHGGIMLVDDAHGLGVVDAVRPFAAEPDVVVTATLSKSLGGAGGVVGGPPELVRHLIDTGRTFIFDTALPPALAAGTLTAARIARTSPGLAAEVRERAGLGYARLSAAGLTARRPDGGVLSVAAPSAELAVEWAEACFERGVAVGCFRPPSTPDHVSRLRLTVNAGVPRAVFEEALEKVVEAAPWTP